MKITLREDSVELEGYVNAVGRDSRQMTDELGFSFREQMQPGVFARSLNEREKAGKPIRILLNHDSTRELGSTESNLVLEEDSIGLHALCTITDPEVIDKARKNELVGWSFGFYQLDAKEEWGENGRRVIVTELDLDEVSIIDTRALPAYAGTSVHTRSEDKPKPYRRTDVADETQTEPAAEEKPTAEEIKRSLDTYNSQIEILRRSMR